MARHQACELSEPDIDDLQPFHPRDRWLFFLSRNRQPAPAELLPFLRFNTGLDVLYVVVAGFLLSRKKPMLRGFGLGVLVQGAFLLLFDGYFWWKCAQAIG